MLRDTESEIIFILTDRYSYESSLVVDIREDGRMTTDITLNGDYWFTVDETDINLNCNHLGRLKRISPYLNLFQCPKCGGVIG